MYGCISIFVEWYEFLFIYFREKLTYTLRALVYELLLDTFLWENKKVANFFLHFFYLFHENGIKIFPK